VARIHEEVIIIKLSQLIKDSDESTPESIMIPESMAALAQVTEELVGAGVVVEIERA
jgi:hypothetical protein